MIIFLGKDDLYKEIIDSSKGDKDIVVSCQYRHKVPQSLIASHTCVNIHYGALPFFAGCNPIYWQILKSDTATVTLHYMDENFDSGDIIDTYSFPIGVLDADEIYEVCEQKGVKLLKRWYKAIVEDRAPRKKQDLSFRKYYSKEMVDFEKEKRVGLNEVRRIRALHFPDKQKPIVRIAGKEYEICRYNASV